LAEHTFKELKFECVELKRTQGWPSGGDGDGDFSLLGKQGAQSLLAQRSKFILARSPLIGFLGGYYSLRRE
jgi:hypothetical protein